MPVPSATAPLLEPDKRCARVRRCEALAPPSKSPPPQQPMPSSALPTSKRCPANVQRTPLERQVDIIKRMKPRGFFAACDSILLNEVASHMLQANAMRAKLAAADIDADPVGYKLVSGLVSKESAHIHALSRSLRLTPQSRYRPDAAINDEPPIEDEDDEAAARLATGRRPWEDPKLPPGCDPKFPGH